MKFLTAKGIVRYTIWRNGEQQNTCEEYYHDSFKNAFCRMFPNFKAIDETERKIEAHCVMGKDYFEIVAVDTLV